MVVVMVGLLDFVLGWVGGGCSSPLSLSLSLSIYIYIYIYFVVVVLAMAVVFSGCLVHLGMGKWIVVFDSGLVLWL